MCTVLLPPGVNQTAVNKYTIYIKGMLKQFRKKRLYRVLTVLRNRWQDGAREDGRMVGGEGWQEKIHNREEWQMVLRTARNCYILHMSVE